MRAVIISDREAVILWTNPRLCTMLQYTDCDIVGRNLLEFLGDTPDGRLRQQLEKAYEDNTVVSHVHTFDLKDGATVTLEFEIEPIQENGTGGVVYHITVGEKVNSTEVTRRVRRRRTDSFQDTYKFSSLSLAEARALFERLDAAIDESKGYRDPEFSINDASRLIQSNNAYVSAIVNFFTDLSVPQYINYKRLGHVLQNVRGRDPNHEVPLWSEAGYGSYHAYYRHIKAEHNMTPSQLLHQILEAD